MEDKKVFQMKLMVAKKQLTEGCNNKACTNDYCHNNPNFKFNNDKEIVQMMTKVALSNNYCSIENWIPEIIRKLFLKHSTTKFEELQAQRKNLFFKNLNKKELSELCFNYLREAKDCPEKILKLSPIPKIIKKIYHKLIKLSNEIPEVKEKVNNIAGQFLEPNVKLEEIIGEDFAKLKIIPFLLYEPLFKKQDENRIEKICLKIQELSKKSKNVLRSWFARYQKMDVEDIMQSLQSYITLKILTKSVQPKEMISVLETILMFVDANSFISKLPFSSHYALPPEFFYNDIVNTLDLGREIERYYENLFSFFASAFLFNSQTKGEIILIQTRILKERKFRNELLHRIFTGEGTPYFHMFLRRDHMIEDALVTIDNVEESELTKQLRIHFEGEDGIDEGGVTKEFFVLITKELFNPQYGMFTTNLEGDNESEGFMTYETPSKNKTISSSSKPSNDTNDKETNNNGRRMSIEKNDDDKAISPSAEELNNNNNNNNYKNNNSNESKNNSSSDGKMEIEKIKVENKKMEKEDKEKEKEKEKGTSKKDMSNQKFTEISIESELISPSKTAPPESQTAYFQWFSPYFREDTKEYRLIGTMLGMAIYNNVILDLHFPMAVYKKLLCLPTTLKDLEEIQPEMANSLRYLLDMEDASELGQTFCVVRKVFGRIETIDLCEDGSKKLVTNENREEYIKLYLKWFFDDSIAAGFSEFKKGFDKTVSEFTKNLHPNELKNLIVGTDVLDFSELKKTSIYDGGFTPESKTVCNFWDILINELDEKQKRKFLHFVTSCDRAPVGGLGAIHLIIQRNGPDTEQLPTSHTCFNLLLLPEYESKEKLKKKLLIAINNSEGFGLN